MNYAEFETQDRRLVVLRALEKAAQYRANAFLLRRFCEAVGHTVSSDKLATDLAWLAEQGLVTTRVDEGITTAQLTERGLDVATDRAQVPGVARPQPGF